MPRKELQADEISCSAAIGACEKGAQWEATLGFLREMPRKSLQSDLFSLDAAMSSCAKGTVQ